MELRPHRGSKRNHQTGRLIMPCELCCTRHLKEIWRNEHFYLIDVSSAEFPCYLRLISTRHVPEVTDLPEAEQKELWERLTIIEKVIRETLNPDKVNWAQFGNVVPHMHWHIIARWKDDLLFPDSPWGNAQKTKTPEKTQERNKQKEKCLELLLEKFKAL